VDWLIFVTQIMQNLDRDDIVRAFNTACIEGDIKKVQLLLQHASKLFRCEEGFNCACRYGQFEIVKHLVEFACTYELDYKWAVYYACLYGNTEIACFLTDQGEDYYDWGFYGGCEGGHLDAVMCMQKGSQHVGHVLDADTGLCRAALGGHLDVMVHVVETMGARNLNWAVQYTCYGGYKQALLYLERKCDEFDIAVDFQEAFVYACDGGSWLFGCWEAHSEVIRYLLDKKHVEVDVKEAMREYCRGHRESHSPPCTVDLSTRRKIVVQAEYMDMPEKVKRIILEIVK